MSRNSYDTGTDGVPKPARVFGRRGVQRKPGPALARKASPGDQPIYRALDGKPFRKNQSSRSRYGFLKFF
jgi:hypothetical protein